MNIFYLASDPVEAAQMQCDKHVVKMPTECAQLLCSAHHAFWLSAPWRPTHLNHPCSLWVRTRAENYAWLVLHGNALCEEYTYRYGRTHAAQAVILWAAHSMEAILPHIPEVEFSEPPLMQRALLYHHEGNSIIDTNRAYYVGDKGHFCKWTFRQPPGWFTETMKELQYG